MQTLHKDDPGRSVTLPDGRVVTNMTAADYAGTYGQGEPCSPIPAHILAAAYNKLGHTPEVTP